MINRIGRLHVVTFLILLLSTLGATSIAPLEVAKQQHTNSVIVTADSLAKATQIVAQVGGEVTHALGIIDAVAATVTDAQQAALAAHPDVLAVSNNAAVYSANAQRKLRDEFDSTQPDDYGDGVYWLSPWVEADNDDDDDVTTSSSPIVIDGYLQLSGDSPHTIRAIRLDPTLNATLNIEYRRVGLESADEHLVVQIKVPDMAGWATLDRLSGPGDDATNQSASYDITSFISDNTRIRFKGNSTLDDDAQLLVDFVEIAYTIGTHDKADMIVPISTMLNANELHAQGITGDDITVAIVDTGYHASKALTKNRDGEKRVLMQFDGTTGEITKRFNKRKVISDDTSGHGTHIASIIANSEVDELGRSLGVAPDVNLVTVRAFSAEGQATYADVIQGLDMLMKKRNRLNLRVVNLSFYSEPQGQYWQDPLNQAVMRLWKAGIVVVTGAGNTGPDALTIGAPGNVPYVITVGSLTDNYTPDDPSDDYIPPFSSAGPTYDGFAKPDFLAPGAHVLGLVPEDSTIATDYADVAQGNGYYSLSGTSMSAAATSGVVALMLQADPSLTPDNVKCRLLSTAVPAMDENSGNPAFSIFQQGAGQIDALAAINSTATDCANVGMNIRADIKGRKHYVGNATVDETGNFVLIDETGNEIYPWDGLYSRSSANYAWTGANYAWTGATDAEEIKQANITVFRD